MAAYFAYQGSLAGGTKPGNASAEAQSVDHSRGSGKSVLVVDDEGVVRMFLKETLSRWGYSVDVAAHGVEAVRRLSQQAYAVILTDIEMPHMNGVSLWRHAVEAGHPGSWILMTGSTVPQLERAVPILGKPLRLVELRDTLERAALGETTR